MRRLMFTATLLLAAAVAACSSGPQGEPVSNGDGRSALVELRSEAKFRPQLLSGYTGADTPEDVAPLNAAVNELIDQVLAQPAGSMSEAELLPLIQSAVQQVDEFATEDRERAYRYFREVWTMVGFRGDPLLKIDGL